MVEARIKDGVTNIKIEGTVADITTDVMIIIHEIYKSLLNGYIEHADLFADALSENIDLICDAHFHEKIHLKAMVKGVEQILEMFKQGKEDAAE